MTTDADTLTVPSAWVAPPWFASLTQTLNDHHHRDDRLPLGALTTEIQHWCARGRTSAWRRQDNARSLAADLRLTVTALGTQVAAKLRPELNDLTQAGAPLTGNDPMSSAQTAVTRTPLAR